MPLPLLALLRNWRIVGLCLLLAALALQTWRIGELKDDVKTCKARNLAQVSEWRAKYAEAVSQATAAKAATEAAQAKITNEVGNDTQKRLDALRGALAVSMRQSEANPDSPGSPNLPSTADAARSLDVASDSTVMASDRLHCGEAYIIATGWQGWWREQSQIDRSN
jgi:hypothetical protein